MFLRRVVFDISPRKKKARRNRPVAVVRFDCVYFLNLRRKKKKKLNIELGIRQNRKKSHPILFSYYFLFLLFYSLSVEFETHGILSQFVR